MRKSLLIKKVLFSTVVAAGSLAGVFAYPDAALARVKLITLPVRERVECPAQFEQRVDTW